MTNEKKNPIGGRAITPTTGKPSATEGEQHSKKLSNLWDKTGAAGRDLSVLAIKHEAASGGRT